MQKPKPLTHKQKLRQDEPLWVGKRGSSLSMHRTPRDNAYDVVVVGAGISGALVAHRLCRPGRRILVVDRREPSRGSTSASTAMIQHEIDIPLHKLKQAIGDQKAARVWQRSARAVEDLAVVVRDLAIDCAFERRRTLFLAGSAYGSRALKAEVEARSNAGLDARLLQQSTLAKEYGISSRTAAIDSAISASADPVQLTMGILRHATRQGVEIVSDLEITDLRQAGKEVYLATSDGKIISAQNVVFCTGYEFLACLRGKGHSIVSTWALASRRRLPRPAWLDDYLVWEGADPYLYFRSTPDGRVIVGGEDEDSGAAYRDERKLDGKVRTLVSKLFDLTGIEIGKPDFAWSAAFGITPQGIPIIDRAPGFNNVFVAMGYGGNGITFSQMAADLISAEIDGARDADWDLFSQP